MVPATRRSMPASAASRRSRSARPGSPSGASPHRRSSSAIWKRPRSSAAALRVKVTTVRRSTL